MTKIFKKAKKINSVEWSTQTHTHIQLYIYILLWVILFLHALFFYLISSNQFDFVILIIREDRRIRLMPDPWGPKYKLTFTEKQHCGNEF